MKLSIGSHKSVGYSVSILIFLFSMCAVAFTQTEKIVYSFAGGSDGAGPNGTLRANCQRKSDSLQTKHDWPAINGSVNREGVAIKSRTNRMPDFMV